MRTTTFIYTLSCPISGEIKYIGKANNPKSRLNEHKRMRDKNISKNNWIKNLLDNGLSPILNILEEVTMFEWKDKEKNYIRKFRERGNLLNLCGGANGSEFGNKTSFDGSHARKIVCLSKEGTYIETFNSIKDSREKYGSGITDAGLEIFKEPGKQSKISMCANGLRKTAYGFKWTY